VRGRFDEVCNANGPVAYHIGHLDLMEPDSIQKVQAEKDQEQYGGTGEELVFQR
jgi:hypothetical protein